MRLRLLYVPEAVLELLYPAIPAVRGESFSRSRSFTIQKAVSTADRVRTEMVSIGLGNKLGMLAHESRNLPLPQWRAGPTDESALITKAIADPRAFAPVYEYYVDDIYGYCLRRLGDAELAADVTSQIFIRALTALSRYTSRNGATSFRSWLFTIAHNLVIDTHRTRRYHRSLDDPDTAIVVADSALSPEDHAVASDLRAELIEAMATLTEQQRSVVELRLAGLTGPEIASVLQLHLAAVKSLQFRAYSRLRLLLRERFDAEFGEGLSS